MLPDERTVVPEQFPAVPEGVSSRPVPVGSRSVPAAVPTVPAVHRFPPPLYKRGRTGTAGTGKAESRPQLADPSGARPLAIELTRGGFQVRRPSPAELATLTSTGCLCTRAELAFVGCCCGPVAEAEAP